MSGPHESLRRASQAEALPVVDLLLRSRHATAGIPPGPQSDDQVRDWFRDVGFRSREVWVATDEGALRAMMVLHGDWIEQLFVEPDYLNQGYGSRLLAHAKSIRGELLLWCFQANAPARAFYERHGFQLTDDPSDDNEEQELSIKYHWARP